MPWPISHLFGNNFCHLANVQLLPFGNVLATTDLEPELALPGIRQISNLYLIRMFEVGLTYIVTCTDSFMTGMPIFEKTHRLNQRTLIKAH